MFAAEFGSGQVLWSIFWFFLFAMWVWLVISIYADIIVSKDLSGGAKAMWLAFVILLPYIGYFTYLLIRGDSLAARMSGSSRSPDEIAKLAELHSRGALSDTEYAHARTMAMGA